MCALIVALDVKVLLSRLDRLLRTNHRQIHRDWYERKSLKRGSCSVAAAAAVLLLYTNARTLSVLVL